jgi:hypothetical protein
VPTSLSGSETTVASNLRVRVVLDANAIGSVRRVPSARHTS